MNQKNYQPIVKVVLAIIVAIGSYSYKSIAESKPTELKQVSSGSEATIETDIEAQKFLKNSRKGSHKGVASWYEGTGGSYTAAHKTLPFGSKVRVTNLKNGRSVVVKITDRGPFVRGRVIDLSPKAARAIGVYNSGVGRVQVEVLSNS